MNFKLPDIRKRLREGASLGQAIRGSQPQPEAPKLAPMTSLHLGALLNCLQSPENPDWEDLAAQWEPYLADSAAQTELIDTIVKRGLTPTPLRYVYQSVPAGTCENFRSVVARAIGLTLDREEPSTLTSPVPRAPPPRSEPPTVAQLSGAIVTAMVEGDRDKVRTLMFPALSVADERTARAALEHDLSQMTVWTRDGAHATTLLRKLQQQGLPPKELDRVLDIATAVRHGIHLAKEGLPEGTMNRRILETNWRHLKMELNQLLDSSTELGLSPEQLTDAAAASVLSDAVKLGSDFDIIKHDVAAVSVWRGIFSRYYGPDEGPRALRVSNAILEHQGVPPAFMAIKMRHASEYMATLLGGQDFDTGVQVAEGVIARKSDVDSLTAKIANPYERASDGSYAHLDESPGGRLTLRTSPPEAALLDLVRGEAWHVPNPSHPDYPVSWAVIQADGRANYVTGDGAAKILGTYRGWKTGAASRDALADDGFRSIVGTKAPGSDVVTGGSFGEYGKFFTSEAQRLDETARRDRLVATWEKVKAQLKAPGGWLESRQHALEHSVGRGDENPFVYHDDGRVTVPYLDEPLVYPDVNLDPDSTWAAMAAAARESLAELTPKQRTQLRFSVEIRDQLAQMLRDSDMPQVL